MKKCKLVIAAVVVSLSLVSVSTFAGPTERTPPSIQAQSEPSFSEWFWGLFTF